jgi:acyl carrier protein
MSIGRHLREQSRVERRDALEELVVGYLRDVLELGGEEDLVLDRSYFDLGLTSLKLTEAREHLQRLLDVAIDATVLFNEPTVEHLVDHLTDALSEEGSDAA